MHRFADRLRVAARAVGGLVSTTGFVLGALLISATACLGVGVDMLAGRAWCLITMATVLFALAWLLLRGTRAE